MACELRILDVGHGNCTLIRDGRVAVIDSPNSSTLVDTLEELGITHIDFVLVSHADADHLNGITLLLSQPALTVGRLYTNPNPEKSTRAFQSFRRAVEAAHQRGMEIHTTLAEHQPGRLELGETTLTVLSPRLGDALSGVGGRSMLGDQITANSASVVLKLSAGADPLALIPADMTAATLTDLQSRHIDLSAPLLVFPHHGGQPEGADPGTFATALMAAVGASTVVFSLGRGMYGTPLPAIVSAVLQAGARIACTQLSANCADNLSGLTFEHLDPAPARGRPRSACCGGTLIFTLAGALAAPILEAHAHFVGTQLPGALCRLRGSVH